MAASDFIELNPGSGGKKLAVDTNATVSHQRVKLQYGEPGLPTDVTAANPLPGEIVGRASGEGAKVTNGGLDVNVQDQNTRGLDLRFSRAIAAATTPSVAISADDSTITLTSTTGFTDGTWVCLAEGDDFYFGTQLGAPAGSVISLDTPIDRDFTTAAVVTPMSYDMAVDGSSTNVVFQISVPGSTISIDIVRVLGYLQDATAMDDGKFGGVTALTSGCYMRQVDGVISNFWNVKTNNDIALLGFDFTYSSAAPGGSYGARFRITYAGQDKHGVTIRLEPGETLEVVVQDNLTGLEEFNMMAQGHVVE